MSHKSLGEHVLLSRGSAVQVGFKGCARLFEQSFWSAGTARANYSTSF